MINYNRIMLCLVLAGITTLSVPSNAQTLKNSLQEAINRSPTIKYHKGKVASADSSIGEARSGWLPNVSVNTGNELTNTNSNNSNDDGKTYSVKVEQNLFDFGRTGDRVDYAKYNKSTEVYSAYDEAEVLSSKVAEVYLNIIKFQQIIDITNKNKAEHLNILHLAQARADGGVDSLGDVEQVEVRIKGLEADLSGYEAQLKAAQEDYYILVGKRPSELIDPDLTAIKNKLTGHMRERISESPRIQAMRATKDAASAEYAYTSKSWMPALSVSVSQGKTTTYGENDTLVMLNVNSNIFDGGGAIYRSRGAAQRVESARWNIEKSIEDLSTKISQMYQDALSQERQIDIYSQRITHSLEVKSLYHEQYKVNRRSVLDLLNAEQELFQTMSNKVSSEFNFKILLVRIFSELGQINSAFNINVDFKENNDNNFIVDIIGFGDNSSEGSEKEADENTSVDASLIASSVNKSNEEEKVEAKELPIKEIVDKNINSTSNISVQSPPDATTPALREIEDPLALIGVQIKK
ncbi:TolC family protein [Leminorella grimontii]|uniref:TolC family protein n=1 Tax=Leminorella grimontii TaxID=82981 RepID=UPI002084F94B|nr:TolC family protein [Leminorella grimontii]GKX58005.1 hypothetical protein SOASR031_03200 [Leminorella grimontii]